MLVYWLVLLTFQTPWFSVIARSETTPHLSLIGTKSRSNDNGALFHPSSLNLHPSLIAFFSALIFLSHPIQTQAVTYITQRFTSLATMFYLLSLVLYTKWRLKTEGQGELVSCILYLASVLCAVLAMKTKEISFTLPTVITLYELMFFNGNTKKRLLHLIPLILTMLIIPFSLINIGKPIENIIGDISETASAHTSIPRLDYFFRQFRLIVTYIRLLFLPINQNLDYDYLIYNSFLNPNVFLSFLLLLAILGLGVYLFRRSKVIAHSSWLIAHGSKPSDYQLSAISYRLISFGIFWFFITLSIESSIIPIADVIFEHRVYLPSIGLIITFVSAIFYLFLRFKTRLSLATCSLLLATVVLVLSIATYQRNIIWQDGIRLWEDVVKKSPGNTRGHSNVGFAYYNHGRLDDAIEEYKIAIKLKPDFVDPYIHLGEALAEKGLWDEAEIYFAKAMELKEGVKLDSHTAMGLLKLNKEGILDFQLTRAKKDVEDNPGEKSFMQLGFLYMEKGEYNLAIEVFRKALEFNPSYCQARIGIGSIYTDKGMIDEAINEYKKAIMHSPDCFNANIKLGVLYATQTGQKNMAIAEFKRAININPSSFEAHNNLGVAYDELGQLDKAIAEYQHALKLSPDNADAHYNLGLVYKKMALTDKARLEFQKALQLKPNHQEALIQSQMLDSWSH
ncbi:MAG: tetratricopeptide repeat protein [Nitrospirae bacterium]|nr:tetratricopeptide repeat protein [Nitrospirota bacterium]